MVKILKNGVIKISGNTKTVVKKLVNEVVNEQEGLFLYPVFKINLGQNGKRIDYGSLLRKDYNKKDTNYILEITRQLCTINGSTYSHFGKKRSTENCSKCKINNINCYEEFIIPSLERLLNNNKTILLHNPYIKT